MRDPRYDILFEPVKIGPLTAKNRFLQVPHCNGMGYRDVASHAAMRGVKAEGGWAVVNTELAEIHYSSEITPFIEARIWDDGDIPALQLVVNEVHAHDALAGIELCYSGMNGPNLHTRVPALGPAHLPIATFTADPIQARAMTKRDFENVRRWHRQAVARSIDAGFDLIYLYGGHALGFLHHMLSPRYNQRTDEYGGSIENRMRILREILEDAQEEAAGRVAIACRITVDELIGPAGIDRGQIETIIGELGEIPDLWDFVPGAWEEDSVTSRFGGEGEQEKYVKGLKALTSKPVVGVGRFTSPDTMVRMIKQGVLDMIGAARPSIADPFLPKKIEEGRLEDIRECIGCNICVSGDFTQAPVRCTQNPTMGEEWRRGWHPEVYRPKHADEKIMVVGAGPAGLEAAMSLGKRGYEVVLIERTRELGGRVARESRLPGLAAWVRVLDYREAQIRQLKNVEIYRESDMSAGELLGYEFDHIAIATGSRWRDDGIGRWHLQPIPVEGMAILTPDDIMSGARPEGERVAIYDDDHYYLGGVIAELLKSEGYDVVLVTPNQLVSAWMVATMEQYRVERRLLELDVELQTSTALTAIADGKLHVAHALTEAESELSIDSAVFVTARLPNEELFIDLQAKEDKWSAAGLKSVQAIGDALAPGTIANAVWLGRQYAEEFNAPTRDSDTAPFRRERTQLPVA